MTRRCLICTRPLRLGVRTGRVECPEGCKPLATEAERWSKEWALAEEFVRCWRAAERGE